MIAKEIWVLFNVLKTLHSPGGAIGLNTKELAKAYICIQYL